MEKKPQFGAPRRPMGARPAPGERGRRDERTAKDPYFTNEQIREIQDVYRYLYLSQLNVSDAVERIEAELPASKERDEIIMFIRNSKRGIIRGYV